MLAQIANNYMYMDAHATSLSGCIYSGTKHILFRKENSSVMIWLQFYCLFTTDEKMHCHNQH